MVKLLKPFILFTLLFIAGKASAAYLEVTLLGTGTPQPNIERFGSATLVKANGHYFLFDSGRGTTIRLKQAGVPLSQINQVFLTHLHSDHVSGLSDLMLTTWIWQRQKPITITGPKGTNSLSYHIEQAYQADIAYRSANTRLDETKATLNSIEIKEEGIVYNDHGIQITAFLVNHYPVDPAYGYKIESGDQSIVISGDTSYSENLVVNAQGADLIIHEIADARQALLNRNPRLKKVMAYHTTPEQAARVFRQTQPKAAVYNHVLLFGISEQQVMNKTRALYDGKVEMGRDLMKIGVGEQIIFY